MWRRSLAILTVLLGFFINPDEGRAGSFGENSQDFLCQPQEHIASFYYYYSTGENFCPVRTSDSCGRQLFTFTAQNNPLSSENYCDSLCCDEGARGCPTSTTGWICDTNHMKCGQPNPDFIYMINPNNSEEVILLLNSPICQ